MSRQLAESSSLLILSWKIQETLLGGYMYIYLCMFCAYVDKTTRAQNISNTLHAILNVGLENSLLLIFLAGKNVTN